METQIQTFYSDLNGRIECVEHMGNEAKAHLAAGFTPQYINTSMTRWEKMTEQEASEFSELIGLNHTICETCRFTK
jgi:hypothetical protein